MSSAISHFTGWFPVAVQALVVIAGSEGLCSSSTMAQGLHAHAAFVRRVLAQLVRANVVQAREGRDGGYRLARSAEHITLAEVYQAVKLTDQGGDAACRSDVTAGVLAVLDEVGAEVEQRLLEVLGQYTLDSVMERVGGSPGRGHYLSPGQGSQPLP
jgi:Rrf2 family transcriptional repressor of oqxAB